MGLVGENGVGKTTLLNSMMERSSNYTGNIFYQGIDIQKEPEWFLEKCVYFTDITELSRRSNHIDDYTYTI